MDAEKMKIHDHNVYMARLALRQWAWEARRKQADWDGLKPLLMLAAGILALWLGVFAAINHNWQPGTQQTERQK